VLATATPAGATPVSVRPDRPWRRAWLTGLATWAVAYVTYLAINATFWMVRDEDPVPLREFFNVWNRWDTGHYEYIASNGYDLSTANPAFFPLYPMLMRALDPVLPGQMLAASLIIASIACIAALAVFTRLAEDLFDVSTGQRTALYLIASPFGFYLVAGYNESLFVALCVASMYCMRKGYWWYAGAFGAFASATRYFGAALALAFVIEYLRQRDWDLRRLWWDALAVLLVPAGLIAYMVYSARTFGNPLEFAELQQSNWGHRFSAPWTSIIESVKLTDTWWHDAPFHTWFVLNVLDLGAVPVILALLVLSLVGPWKLGDQAWYLVAFGIAAFGSVLISPVFSFGLPPLHGLPRYALEMVPLYLVLARMGQHRAFERAYLFPTIGLQSALLLAYFSHIFIS
jgi:hypothetical protein